MLQMKALRLVRTLHILVAVLPACGLQLYAQHLVDPRTNPFAARDTAGRAAAAAKVAAAKDASIAQVMTIPPPTAVGTFTTFDLPGFVDAFTINDNGAITGFYSDSLFNFHGFVRAANGTITTFDIPGALGTFPSGISNNDAITGGYADNIGSGFHGFVRAANGTLLTFDAPGGVNGTEGLTINPNGTVGGAYLDANFISHCFLRMSDGTLTTIDPQGAVNGCFPSEITPDGAILEPIPMQTILSMLSCGPHRAPSPWSAPVQSADHSTVVLF